MNESSVMEFGPAKGHVPAVLRSQNKAEQVTRMAKKKEDKK
jgi:hypothetical protein